MINIPLPKIKEKILEDTDLSEDSLNKKIKEKLDQLSGLISEEGAAHIVANELGVKLVQATGRLQVKNVVSGMRNVEIVGKVAKKYEVRTFNTGERSGKVGNLMLADDTGFIRIVMWNEQADIMDKIKEGDSIMIKSGYVRNNNNKPEIHLNDSSEVQVNPTGLKLDFEVEDIGPKRKKLVDLEETDDNVEVLATIVQAFEPRFFEVCPGCGKRSRESGDAYECPTHGKINEPDYSYVMNLFLDDGSDNIRTVLWRSQVQRLLDLEDEAVQKFRENPLEFEQQKTDLLGNIVLIRGRVQKNEGFDRLELVANYVIKDPDPEKEIKKLKENEAKDSDDSKKEKSKKDDDSEKISKEPEAKKEVDVSVKKKVESTPKEVSLEEDEVDLADDDEDIPSIDDL